MNAANWKAAVSRRLEAMDWHKARLEVGKFLEHPQDVATLDKHNALRLLATT